jgi:hypothetical protein
MSIEADLYRVQSLATGLVLDGNTDRKIYAMANDGGAFQKWKLSPTTP